MEIKTEKIVNSDAPGDHYFESRLNIGPETIVFSCDGKSVADKITLFIGKLIENGDIDDIDLVVN